MFHPSPKMLAAAKTEAERQIRAFGSITNMRTIIEAGTIPG